MSSSLCSESTESRICRVWSNIDIDDDENENARERPWADISDEELNEPQPDDTNNTRAIVVQEPLFKLCQEAEIQTMLPFIITYKFEAQTAQLFEGFTSIGMPQQFRFAGKDFHLQNFVSRQTGRLCTIVLLEGDRRDCEMFGIKIRITISEESESSEPCEVYNNVLRPAPISSGQQAGSAQESFIVTNWNTRTFQCVQIKVKKIINMVVTP